MRNTILNLIDFFYPPFKKWIGKQTFSYLVCGGSNAALNLLVFYIGNNFLFTTDVTHILGYPITGYIAAYLLALSISFPVGFCLNRYVVFLESNLEIKIQLIRYLFITVTSILLDYLLLHLLVGYFKFWATPSQAFIIVILSLFSYFSQTYFTFKTVKNRE